LSDISAAWSIFSNTNGLKAVQVQVIMAFLVWGTAFGAKVFSEFWAVLGSFCADWWVASVSCWVVCELVSWDLVITASSLSLALTSAESWVGDYILAVQAQEFNISRINTLSEFTAPDCAWGAAIFNLLASVGILAVGEIVFSITAFFVDVVFLNVNTVGGFTIGGAQANVLSWVNSAAFIISVASLINRAVKFWGNTASFSAVCVVTELFIDIAAWCANWVAFIISRIFGGTSVTNFLSVGNTALVLG